MTETIRHVCLFRLKRQLSTPESERLERFAAEMLASDKAIRAYRFVRNTARKASGFSLVLYSEFESAAALADYVRTSLHEELAAFMDSFVEQTVVADFPFDETLGR